LQGPLYIIGKYTQEFSHLTVH